MLQSAFYTIGIICMTLYTLLLIAIVILLFYIKKKINEFTDSFHDKIETVKEITSHPKEVAASVGAAVADTAITKATQAMHSQKRTRKK